MAVQNKTLVFRVTLCLLFCLFGLQYWSLLSANEKTRFAVPSELSSLFKLNWNHVTIVESKLSSRKHILSSNVTDNRKNDTSSLEEEEEEEETLNSTKPCPMIPTNLHGPYKVRITEDEVPSTLAEIETMFEDLTPGGRFSPRGCKSRHRVAIIVPYRDRMEHLKIFLLNLHMILLRQQLDYGIFIIEQYGSDNFNRAMLFNVGVTEAIKAYDYQCFIFHDVDLIPEDDRNLYNCPAQPRHMSVAIDTFNYKLPYDGLFGGVSAMTLDQFKKVNGFSNVYWGWGGEDDDMSNRIRVRGMFISRYPANIARYKMLKHPKEKANPDRYKILKHGVQRIDKDGFNSTVYEVVKLELKRLYTWILVDLKHIKP